MLLNMLKPTDMSVGLFYLNRKAEGEEPVRRFFESYKKFPAGISHQLIIIYKGYKAEELESASKIFESVEHKKIILEDNMTDIDSYIKAAHQCAQFEYLCFLNTFSIITTKNWLNFLTNAVDKNDVGIAGATGSFESLLNSCRLVSKLLWAINKKFLTYDEDIYLSYKSLIDSNFPYWKIRNIHKILMNQILNKPKNYQYLNQFDNSFEEYWKIITEKDNVYYFLSDYPNFPNPNIRSNAFIVRREFLKPYFNDSSTRTKTQSYLFESGQDSLTRQILNKGKRALIVNSDNNVFDINEWHRSDTFRLGGQSKLLILDNQTRNFENLNQYEKIIYGIMTWGNIEYKNELLMPYTFGIEFKH